MSTFDELAKENSDLINNFRPTQPLNGRAVYDMDCTSQVGYKSRKKNINLILHNFHSPDYKRWQHTICVGRNYHGSGCSNFRRGASGKV